MHPILKHPLKMDSSKQLGFAGLVAIVFGMVVGSGIYNLPQNMAAQAGLGAVVISWVVTAFCMLFLVATFKTLADRRPDMKAGIYEYARAGFGNYLGFNMAWGYWLCACFANIAYAAMLNDSFGAFFPVFLDHGWPTVALGSGLIWVMYFLVVNGIKTAKAVNMVLAVLKVIAISFILVLLVLNVKMGLFSYDFWGRLSDLGGLDSQINSTVMVTLWCFLGIEGAVMMAARARNPMDVGRAGLTGFFLAWILYVLVSVLCSGVMTQPELASLENPSVAYVLRTVVGDWAYYFVIVSIIVSLIGGWVSWSLICAQVPMEAAEVGIFPKKFLKLNRNAMPGYATFVSSVIMQIFLFFVVMADNIYLAALSISGMMILPPYFFSGLYLWKATLRPEWLRNPSRVRLLRFRVVGVICSINCLWMIYAGGLDLLMLSSWFYLPGFFFYVKVRNRDRRPTPRNVISCFTVAERWQLAAMVACAVMSALFVR